MKQFTRDTLKPAGRWSHLGTTGDINGAARKLANQKRELVRHVVESLRLERSETVIIGDRVHDIEAGCENGIFAVGAAWGYGTAEEFVAADYICESPAGVSLLFG